MTTREEMQPLKLVHRRWRLSSLADFDRWLFKRLQRLERKSVKRKK